VGSRQGWRRDPSFCLSARREIADFRRGSLRHWARARRNHFRHFVGDGQVSVLACSLICGLQGLAESEQPIPRTGHSARHCFVAGLLTSFYLTKWTGLRLVPCLQRRWLVPCEPARRAVTDQMAVAGVVVRWTHVGAVGDGRPGWRSRISSGILMPHEIPRAS